MPRDAIADLLFEESAASTTSTWRPRADVYRTDEGWLVKLDLAGVRPEDVKVSLQGSLLTISGCRRDWLLQQGWDHLQLEIAYNCFERRLQLPCGPGPCGLSTEFRNGFLLVRVEPSER